MENLESVYFVECASFIKEENFEDESEDFGNNRDLNSEMFQKPLPGNDAGVDLFYPDVQIKEETPEDELELFDDEINNENPEILIPKIEYGSDPLTNDENPIQNKYLHGSRQCVLNEKYNAMKMKNITKDCSRMNSSLKVCSCKSCVKLFVQNMHFPPSQVRAYLSTNNLHLYLHECDICDKVFDSKSKLISHKICDHHRDGTVVSKATDTYFCEVCGIYFDSKSKLISHKICSHHGIQPVLTCKVCSITFPDPKQLLRHSKQHNPHKKFTCKVCNMTFHKLSQLNKHAKCHHRPTLFTCKCCHKSFKKVGFLKRHYKVYHSGQEDFQALLKMS